MMNELSALLVARHTTVVRREVPDLPAYADLDNTGFAVIIHDRPTGVVTSEGVSRVIKHYSSARASGKLASRALVEQIIIEQEACLGEMTWD